MTPKETAELLAKRRMEKNEFGFESTELEGLLAHLAQEREWDRKYRRLVAFGVIVDSGRISKEERTGGENY